MLDNTTHIIDWLKSHEITRFFIHDDLSVDVFQNVSCAHENLLELPFQFREISGNFDCSDNELAHLTGAPCLVKGTFNCSKNQLTNLNNTPLCLNLIADSNRLSTLEGLLEGVEHLSVRHNLLISTQGCTQSVSKLYVSHNRLHSLIDLPDVMEMLNISFNPLESFKGSPKEVNYLEFVFTQIDSFKDMPIVDMELKFHGSLITSFCDFKINSRNELDQMYCSKGIESWEGAPKTITGLLDVSAGQFPSLEYFENINHLHITHLLSDDFTLFENASYKGLSFYKDNQLKALSAAECKALILKERMENRLGGKLSQKKRKI